MQTFELVKIVDPKKGTLLIRRSDFDPAKHKLFVEQPAPSPADATVKPVAAPVKPVQAQEPKSKSQVRREKFMFEAPKPQVSNP